MDEGPIPAVHGVVRWRACDLIMRLHDLKKNFHARVEEIRSSLAPDTPVEVWFQDEMRVGQKNKLTYRWARKAATSVMPPKAEVSSGMSNSAYGAQPLGKICNCFTT